MNASLPVAPSSPADRIWPSLLAWALGWVAMLLLDGRVDLANLAMLLVLCSALASLWSPTGVSMALSAASVVAFNWFFVPPRGTLSVAAPQNALLLGAMLGVSSVLAVLISRERVLARRAREHADEAQQLRYLSDLLRDGGEPLSQTGVLREVLASRIGGPVLLMALKGPLPMANDSQAVSLLGEPDEDQLGGLWLCMRESTPFGPGTGRHEGLREWYLPLRGRQASFGAAVVRPPAGELSNASLRAHAQALCDQMGLALQRARTEQAARAAREQAQAEGVRNAMLAAISHDYRTPLATILAAASSLQEQGARLTPEHRQRLLASVLEETARLRHLTENTLQLARLESPGATLQRDWESAEEIVGAVLRRARQHDPQHRVRARVEPGLPLLHCDALLLAQMLENLVDNALKYSPQDAPVEILARCQQQHMVLAVRDRGPGVAPGWRERVFDVFQRAPTPPGDDAAPRQGAGVGLAVCRAIARAHGGELRLRARSHGGSSFECWLALEPGPPAAVEAQERSAS
ncbi:ATP-binding protein [Ideonella sp. BN130291]|uniref:ATP-binding protein n=1 Tax=Ideonella sp. BN130291 TaxID=3112940 RepID=UPI002E2598C0|nr:ATP-binding protein [Ideonella sp. BN130291]